jgi:hypothetical protein
MLELRDIITSDRSYLTTHKVYGSTFIYLMKITINLWTIFSHMQALKLSCDERAPPSLTQQNHSKIEIRDSTPVILQTVMKYDCVILKTGCICASNNMICKWPKIVIGSRGASNSQLWLVIMYFRGLCYDTVSVS